MWLHVSDDEKRSCVDLRQTNVQNLPVPNDTNIPDDPKTIASPAPRLPALPEHPQNNLPEGLLDDSPEAPRDKSLAAQPDKSPVAPTVASAGSKSAPTHQPVSSKDVDQPPSKRAKVNTTAFPFWPDPKTTKDSLAVDKESDEAASETGESDKARNQRRRWLAAGVAYPEKEEEFDRWHGIHFLGEGSAGRVGMWVRVDQNKLIDGVRLLTDLKYVCANWDKRLAVRDVTCDPYAWINPVQWRVSPL